ncbi:unnamed protein product [Calypogeia fissa]
MSLLRNVHPRVLVWAPNGVGGGGGRAAAVVAAPIAFAVSSELPRSRGEACGGSVPIVSEPVALIDYRVAVGCVQRRGVDWRERKRLHGDLGVHHSCAVLRSERSGPTGSRGGSRARAIISLLGSTEGGETPFTMGKGTVAEELVEFINASPTAFHAVRESKARLSEAGFAQLSERETWKLELGGKYFFTRNHSTLLAFTIGKKFEAGKGFLAIGAHTDSPCPKLKPVSKVAKGGFLEIGVQTYGGGLWHTWFDRDLTVAGRVVVKRVKDGMESFSHELVRVPRPILRVPTLAIHLDRGVMEHGFKVNTQTHLVPILATAIKEEASKPVASTPSGDANGGSEKKASKGSNHHPLLLQVLSEELDCHPEDITTFDLDVVDTQLSAIGGALNEFIFSARLDNLCSSFCSLKALIDASSSESALDEETGVRMIALFDHEEVGSSSAQGAGSPVMVDALRRITTYFTKETSSGLYEQAIQNSFLVSADMAHALHPNYQDKHEENHQPKIHSGIVIKHNANQRYATNAVTAFLFREIGDRNQLPSQDFLVRNDMACGSTIGPILASGIGIRTVDVGTPQLSMHSVREMCGVDDVGHSYLHYKAFFEGFTQLDAKLSVDN